MKNEDKEIMLEDEEGNDEKRLLLEDKKLEEEEDKESGVVHFTITVISSAGILSGSGLYH